MLNLAASLPPEEVEVFIQELQRLMNGFKVTKIDMALDPFNKGKIKFQHKGPNTINLN